MTHSYEWHDAFLCETCNMTHPHVWHDEYPCMTYIPDNPTPHFDAATWYKKFSKTSVHYKICHVKQYAVTFENYTLIPASVRWYAPESWVGDGWGSCAASCDFMSLGGLNTRGCRLMNSLYAWCVSKCTWAYVGDVNMCVCILRLYIYVCVCVCVCIYM